MKEHRPNSNSAGKRVSADQAGGADQPGWNFALSVLIVSQYKLCAVSGLGSRGAPRTYLREYG